MSGEPVTGPFDASLYLNRELSLLAFQERVLEEAFDPANPLIERAKYLAIFSSNLSEFYMVRVAGLKQQVAAGATSISDDGLTAAEQLATVRDASPGMLERARQCFRASGCWTTPSLIPSSERWRTRTSEARSSRS
jgi:polyphosphate kinase